MGTLILQSVLASKPPLYLRHRSPGRLRVGSDYFHTERPGLVKYLEIHPSVKQASQSTHTGSLLICFDENVESEVFHLLLDQLPGRERKLTPDVKPKFLPYVGHTLKNVDRAVYTVSNGWFDAQVLVPTFLWLYGVRRLVSKKPRLPTWVTILWWSYATLWSLSQMDKRR